MVISISLALSPCISSYPPNVRVLHEQRGNIPPWSHLQRLSWHLGSCFLPCRTQVFPCRHPLAPATKERLGKQTPSGWLIKNTNAFTAKHGVAIMPEEFRQHTTQILPSPWERRGTKGVRCLRQPEEQLSQDRWHQNKNLTATPGKEATSRLPAAQPPLLPKF